MKKKLKDLTKEDIDKICEKYYSDEPFCCEGCPLKWYCPCFWDDEKDICIEVDD